MKTHLRDIPTGELRTALKVINAIFDNREVRETAAPHTPTFKEATAAKIRREMKRRGISFAKLGVMCGITKSAAYNMVWNLEHRNTVTCKSLNRIVTVLFRDPKKPSALKKAAKRHKKMAMAKGLEDLNRKFHSIGEMMAAKNSAMTDRIKKVLEECNYDLIAAMEILNDLYRPSEVWDLIAEHKLLVREKVQPMIISALRQTRGQITEAAKKIGMHRPVMVDLITEWKLSGYCSPGGIDRGAR